MSFPYITDIVNAVLGTAWHLPIPTFGIVVGAAIVLAARVARTEVERRESLGALPPATAASVLDLALVSALAGLVGARVFYVLDHPTEFLADPAAMIFSRSGFSIYGGLCFGVAAGIGFLRRRAILVVPMLDAVAPAMMLGYGIGRLGCQLAGDGDWGIPANMALKPDWLPGWLWAQTYDGNILGIAIPPPGVYPTPIYESAAALVLFAVLWGLRLRKRRPGWLFSAYLLLAGFERLLIEKIRVNPEHDLWGMQLTQAEILSVLCILAGLGGVLFTLGRRRLWAKALVSASVLAALSACAQI